MVEFREICAALVRRDLRVPPQLGTELVIRGVMLINQNTRLIGFITENTEIENENAHGEIMRVLPVNLIESSH